MFPGRKCDQTVIGGSTGDFCGGQSVVSIMRRLGREDQWLCEILVNQTCSVGWGDSGITGEPGQDCECLNQGVAA